VSQSENTAIASDNQVCLVAVYGQPVDFAPLATNKKKLCNLAQGYRRIFCFGWCSVVWREGGRHRSSVLWGAATVPCIGAHLAAFI
jgi:hypothetical protein